MKSNRALQNSRKYIVVSVIWRENKRGKRKPLIFSLGLLSYLKRGGLSKEKLEFYGKNIAL